MDESISSIKHPLPIKPPTPTPTHHLKSLESDLETWIFMKKSWILTILGKSHESLFSSWNWNLK